MNWMGLHNYLNVACVINKIHLSIRAGSAYRPPQALLLATTVKHDRAPFPIYGVLLNIFSCLRLFEFRQPLSQGV